MGLWNSIRHLGVREEHTHFNRDNEGNVVGVERRNWREVNADRVDDARGIRLSRRQSHVERKQWVAEDRAEAKAIEEAEYRKALHEENLRLARERGREHAKRGGGSKWEHFILGGTRGSRMIAGGRPVQRNVPRLNFGGRVRNSGFNQFSSMLGGVPKKPKSGKGNRRYVIQGGVAYPLAGGHKKKSHKKSHRSNPFDVGGRMFRI